MAHFAKIGINSKVIGVHAVDNKDLLNADGVEDESVGKQFLERIHGWPLWVQTSYNNNAFTTCTTISSTWRGAATAPSIGCA